MPRNRNFINVEATEFYENSYKVPPIPLENIRRSALISANARVDPGLIHIRAVTPAQVYWCRIRPCSSQGVPMLDIILIALGLGFFIASVAYVYACDQL